MTDPEKMTPEVEESSKNSLPEENAVEIVVESVVEEETPAAEEKNVHTMSKEELIAALREIVETENVNAHKDVVAIRQALYSIRQRELNDELKAYVEQGGDPIAFSSTPDECENESKELIAKFRELRAAFLEAENVRLEENLAKKREILASMKAIIEDADNVNVQFPKFQELQQEFRSAGDVPPTAQTEIWKEFQMLTEQFYDTLKMNKELRDLDFKKNYESKLQLIERAKALDLEENISEAGRKLQQLREEWREIGPVMKEMRDKVWEDFKEALAAISRKHQEFVERRKEEEKKNEEGKTALCEEVEKINVSTLKNYSDWEAATNKIKELQAQWKSFGFAPHKVNNEIYARFRKVCDDFFTAKSEYMQNLKDSLQANLEKKMALCEKAEALGDVEDLRKNLDEVIRLQAEWKTIGSVPRKHSDAVWERFSKACNKFFEEKKKRDNARTTEENRNLEKKREIIARLKEIPTDIERREGLRLVKELQNEWNEVGHVPFKQKDKVYAQYREVCDTLYGAFNASRQTENRKNYESRVSSMKGDGRKMDSERDKLLRAIEQREQDLKTYRNNLGFFNVKSSAGNAMLKDMERKMARLEEEIQEIREKIAIIDSSKNAE